MFQPSNAFGDPLAFRTIFFEEAQEHLANVEAILLRMDIDAPHPDDLGAIFRAVHSIKGSAAMLGCPEMADLAHLQENLLDLLRKGERPIDADDIEAMLKAGDVLRAQVTHRRGAAPHAPDSTVVEAMLRDRVAQPATDAQGGAAGPVTRSFKVRLGPLDAPIDAGELDMMLAGLGDMGTISNTVVDNVASGSVSFDVLLEGAAADLESVLSLVVAPEQITVEVMAAAAVAADPAALAESEAPKEAPRLHAVPPAAPTVAPTAAGEDEFFVDPAEFRRRSDAAKPAPVAVVAPVTPVAPVAPVAPKPQEDVDMFVSPEQFQKERRRPAAAATVAVAVPVPTPPEPAATVAHEPSAQAHDATFIRVATEKIDLLVNLVGELVITEAMLARSGSLAEA
ncbi:MAG TPA: Hpt domain-containing protein, partial [Ramlibacter sp.]